jgi:hypothetical protein
MLVEIRGGQPNLLGLSGGANKKVLVSKRQIEARSQRYKTYFALGLGLMNKINWKNSPNFLKSSGMHNYIF